MTTVVFFLGGCTYTEISALRWMSKQTKGRRYLIATTGIINGDSVSKDRNRLSINELSATRKFGGSASSPVEHILTRVPACTVVTGPLPLER